MRKASRLELKYAGLVSYLEDSSEDFKYSDLSAEEKIDQIILIKSESKKSTYNPQQKNRIQRYIDVLGAFKKIYDPKSTLDETVSSIEDKLVKEGYNKTDKHKNNGRHKGLFTKKDIKYGIAGLYDTFQDQEKNLPRINGNIKKNPHQAFGKNATPCYQRPLRGLDL